jgi:hypothetical protein
MRHNLPEPDAPVVILARGHSGSRVLAWALQRLGIALGATDDKQTGDIQDRRFTRRIKRIAIARLHGATDDRATDAQARALLRKAAPCKRWIAAHPPDHDPQRWGWKFPETCLIAPVVERAFPDARYIHLIRDGRDIAFKDHLTDDPHRALGRRLLTAAGALHDPTHLRAAKSWAFQERALAEFLRTIPQERRCRVRFEDLVAEPAPTVERCAEFLNLPMTDACREYLADKINPSKIAQHRHEDPALVAQVEAAIADELSRNGYEPTAGPLAST